MPKQRKTPSRSQRKRSTVPRQNKVPVVKDKPEQNKAPVVKDKPKATSAALIKEKTSDDKVSSDDEDEQTFTVTLNKVPVHLRIAGHIPRAVLHNKGDCTSTMAFPSKSALPDPTVVFGPG